MVERDTALSAGAEREARLRAALEPFARLEMPHQEPDHWPAFGKQSGVGWPTVGDFRRARAALSDTPAPASEKSNTEQTNTDCRTPIGGVVGMIDAVITLLRLVNQSEDIAAPEVQAALQDLAADDAVIKIVARGIYLRSPPTGQAINLDAADMAELERMDAILTTPAPASGDTARLIEHDQATALMRASTLPSSDCEEIVSFLNKAGFAIVSTEAPASGTGTRVEGLEEAARWHDAQAEQCDAAKYGGTIGAMARYETERVHHIASATAIRALASREPGRDRERPKTRADALPPPVPNNFKKYLDEAYRPLDVSTAPRPATPKGPTDE